MPESPSPFLQRRTPRLRDYDYAQEGAYFVTICTHNHGYLFGKVVDEKMQLNVWGQIAESCWQAISNHFPHVELDVYVIMPNHMHGIVFIMDRPSGASSTADEPYTPERYGKPIAGSLSTIVRSYKSVVTRQINALRGNSDRKIWQGRYYDHIIRNETALDKIRGYIIHNPAKWEVDKLYAGEG